MKTFQDVKREIHKMDPDVETNDPESFRVAATMVSALVVGADSLRLSKFTGYPLSFVKKVDRRLRTSKIWIGRKTACEWSGKDGGIAFWIDVAVGRGYLKRTEKRP